MKPKARGSKDSRAPRKATGLCSMCGQPMPAEKAANQTAAPPAVLPDFSRGRKKAPIGSLLKK